MRYIKVWCEYDFNGQFGGNNNEEVFSVSDKLSGAEINKLVKAKLVKWTELKPRELSGLHGWEFIEVNELKGEQE